MMTRANQTMTTLATKRLAAHLRQLARLAKSTQLDPRGLPRPRAGSSGATNTGVLRDGRRYGLDTETGRLVPLIEPGHDRSAFAGA